MDDYASVSGASPTSILKKNKKKDVATGVVEHNKPFKLLFTQRKDLGRSYVSMVKPLGLDSSVTPKFYAKEHDVGVSEEYVDKVYGNISRRFRNGPREKYQAPILDSHNYGWYHNINLKATAPHDRRFNYGIRVSHMVERKIFILATDKKTGANQRK